jgi:hypothetical protein
MDSNDERYFLNNGNNNLVQAGGGGGGNNRRNNSSSFGAGGFFASHALGPPPPLVDVGPTTPAELSWNNEHQQLQNHHPDGRSPSPSTSSIGSCSAHTDTIEPAFLNEEDYPPGWLVYHPVLGVVPKEEADQYDRQWKLQQQKQQQKETVNDSDQSETQHQNHHHQQRQQENHDVESIPPSFPLVAPTAAANG